MSRILSDYQKELFYDMYKTILGATISSTPDFFLGGCRKEEAILQAFKLAKVNIEILTDESGLRQPEEVQKIINDKWEEIKGELQ